MEQILVPWGHRQELVVAAGATPKELKAVQASRRTFAEKSIDWARRHPFKTILVSWPAAVIWFSVCPILLGRGKNLREALGYAGWGFVLVHRMLIAALGPASQKIVALGRRHGPRLAAGLAASNTNAHEQLSERKAARQLAKAAKPSSTPKELGSGEYRIKP